MQSLLNETATSKWYVINLGSESPEVRSFGSGVSLELEENWEIEFSDDHALLLTGREDVSICIGDTWFKEGQKFKIERSGEYKVVLPSVGRATPVIVTGGDEPGWVKSRKIEYWMSIDGVNRDGPFSSFDELRQNLVPGEVDGEGLLWIEGSEVAFYIRDIWPETIDRARDGSGSDPESEGDWDKVEGSLICPYCRLSFDEKHYYFSSPRESPGFQGLPFRPTIRDEEGYPLDRFGFRCIDRHCPHDLQLLPESFGPDANYTYFSLLGQPGCGTTTLLSVLFHLLPSCFQRMGEGLSFQCDDPRLAAEVADFSSVPFRPGAPDMRYIEKTDPSCPTQIRIQLKEGKYRRSVPKPFIFRVNRGSDPPRRIVFYNNPGEHFISLGDDGYGAEQARLGLSHLGLASAVFFLFDPTYDVGFAVDLGNEDVFWDSSCEFLTSLPEKMNEREGHPASGKGFDTPLIVLVGKWDTWTHLAPDLQKECYKDGEGLDIRAIRKNSKLLEDLLNHYNTGIPAAVMAISNDIIYIPVSALGQSPQRFEKNGTNCMAPSAPAKPWNIEVPFLWALWKVEPDLVPVVNQEH